MIDNRPDRLVSRCRPLMVPGLKCSPSCPPFVRILVSKNDSSLVACTYLMSFDCSTMRKGERNSRHLSSLQLLLPLPQEEFNRLDVRLADFFRLYWDVHIENVCVWEMLLRHLSHREDSTRRCISSRFPLGLCIKWWRLTCFLNSSLAKSRILTLLLESLVFEKRSTSL